ncbi:hypothetical protein DIPPA_10581 [Diplonema papillatum]|nr:hypothetical protein DIPPA_10581 [Diplonema papillatum]
MPAAREGSQEPARAHQSHAEMTEAKRVHRFARTPPPPQRRSSSLTLDGAAGNGFQRGADSVRSHVMTTEAKPSHWLVHVAPPQHRRSSSLTPDGAAENGYQRGANSVRSHVKTTEAKPSHWLVHVAPPQHRRSSSLTPDGRSLFQSRTDLADSVRRHAVDLLPAAAGPERSGSAPPGGPPAVPEPAEQRTSHGEMEAAKRTHLCSLSPPPAARGTPGQSASPRRGDGVGSALRSRRELASGVRKHAVSLLPSAASVERERKEPRAASAPRVQHPCEAGAATPERRDWKFRPAPHVDEDREIPPADACRLREPTPWASFASQKAFDGEKAGHRHLIVGMPSIDTTGWPHTSTAEFTELKSEHKTDLHVNPRFPRAFYDARKRAFLDGLRPPLRRSASLPPVPGRAGAPAHSAGPAALRNPFSSHCAAASLPASATPQRRVPPAPCEAPSTCFEGQTPPLPAGKQSPSPHRRGSTPLLPKGDPARSVPAGEWLKENQAAAQRAEDAQLPSSHWRFAEKKRSHGLEVSPARQRAEAAAGVYAMASVPPFETIAGWAMEAAGAGGKSHAALSSEKQRHAADFTPCAESGSAARWRSQHSVRREGPPAAPPARHPGQSPVRAAGKPAYPVAGGAVPRAALGLHASPAVYTEDFTVRRARSETEGGDRRRENTPSYPVAEGAAPHAALGLHASPAPNYAAGYTEDFTVRRARSETEGGDRRIDYTARAAETPSYPDVQLDSHATPAYKEVDEHHAVNYTEDSTIRRARSEAEGGGRRSNGYRETGTPSYPHATFVSRKESEQHHAADCPEDFTIRQGARSETDGGGKRSDGCTVREAGTPSYPRATFDSRTASEQHHAADCPEGLTVRQARGTTELSDKRSEIAADTKKVPHEGQSPVLRTSGISGSPGGVAPRKPANYQLPAAGRRSYTTPNGLARAEAAPAASIPNPEAFSWGTSISPHPVGTRRPLVQSDRDASSLYTSQNQLAYDKRTAGTPLHNIPASPLHRTPAPHSPMSYQTLSSLKNTCQLELHLSPGDASSVSHKAPAVVPSALAAYEARVRPAGMATFEGLYTASIFGKDGLNYPPYETVEDTVPKRERTPEFRHASQRAFAAEKAATATPCYPVAAGGGGAGAGGAQSTAALAARVRRHQADLSPPGARATAGKKLGIGSVVGSAAVPPRPAAGLPTYPSEPLDHLPTTPKKLPPRQPSPPRRSPPPVAVAAAAAAARRVPAASSPREQRQRAFAGRGGGGGAPKNAGPAPSSPPRRPADAGRGRAPAAQKAAAGPDAGARAQAGGNRAKSRSPSAARGCSPVQQPPWCSR